jgi:hypothetical protein
VHVHHMATGRPFVSPAVIAKHAQELPVFYELMLTEGSSVAECSVRNDASLHASVGSGGLQLYVTMWRAMRRNATCTAAAARLAAAPP